MAKRGRTSKIIIHCSDSDIKSHDCPEVIRKWHVEENGWSATGYHIIITKDGNSHLTDRGLENIGAHCRGYNVDSIGICLTGKESFSDAQFRGLRTCIDTLCCVYSLTDDDVYPHSYFSDKTCPNFDVKQKLLEYPSF